MIGLNCTIVVNIYVITICDNISTTYKVGGDPAKKPSSNPSVLDTFILALFISTEASKPLLIIYMYKL